MLKVVVVANHCDVTNTILEYDNVETIFSNTSNTIYYFSRVFEKHK